LCYRGREKEAKALHESLALDTNINSAIMGTTGLMAALQNSQHTTARWLLSLPGLDTNLRDHSDRTALHWAVRGNYSLLDLVVMIATRSSWLTVNQQDRSGNTALDEAVQNSHIASALYLSWLGVKCKDVNRNCYITRIRIIRNPSSVEKYSFSGSQEILSLTNSVLKVKRMYRDVTLQTWLEAGCAQQAQFWAVAANDVLALDRLSKTHNINLESEKLRMLAELLDHREVWSFVTSLQNLAWAKVKEKLPALAFLPTSHLLDKKVPSTVMGILLNYRNPESDLL